MRAHVLHQQIYDAMAEEGKGGKEIKVLVDGETIDIDHVVWDAANECFLVVAS